MDIKKIFSEVVHKNPWWEYIHDKYTRSDGKEGNYYYCKTEGAAMVIPVLENGKLVLVRQYRYISEKNSIEFPCGGINKDESALDAVRRELLEETGYIAGDLVKMGEFAPNSGYCMDNTRVFVTNELKQIQEPENKPEEVLEVMYRRIDEFDAMIRTGEIWHGQTLAAWMLSRDYVYNLINNN